MTAPAEKQEQGRAGFSVLSSERVHYHEFLEQVRNEGLKGQIKLLILKVIGFFAWWQEQINSFLFGEIKKIKAEQERDAGIVREDLAALRGAIAAVSGDVKRAVFEQQQVNKALFDELKRVTAEQHRDRDEFKRVTAEQQRDRDVLDHLRQRLVVEMDEYYEQSGANYLQKAIALAGQRGSEVTRDREDVFYSLFENVFYESKVVSEKQKMYLKYIDEELCKQAPFLDVGCGRGEFLTILKDHGILALGVDKNEFEVEDLQRRGFAVECGDALAYLRKSTAEVSGISALQVIEHMDMDYLREFVRLAYGRLHPGGVIILETVNPHSPFAGANFYQDPTHKRPLPPELMVFLLEWSGFRDILTVYCSRIPESARVLTDIRGRDERFYYQDYALVGRK